MKIGGLDIGTTGCKLVVFDENGNYLGKAYRDYPVHRTNSAHEVDISSVMDAVFAVFREMTAQYDDIAGVGVSSFGESCVCADAEGRPLHPAMLYTDPRGEEELRELGETVGDDRIAQITGLIPHTMYSISKLMWLKKHQPEIYAQAKMVLLMEDYVVYHLTGRRQIDYTLATRTMAFDIRTIGWSSEILDAAGIDRNLFSEPVASGTSAGHPTPEALEKTGLKPDAIIVNGCHDQIAAAIGAGASDASIAVDGAGTVECITQIFDELPDVDTLTKGHYPIVPYIKSGAYVSYGFSYTGGALVQWCVETIAKKEKELAANQGSSVNEYLEKKYQETWGSDPSGLLVLPHFAGAATPYMDNGAKGVILGLTTASDVSQIYLGCLEGVVYEMLLNLRGLMETSFSTKRLVAAGGGAKSRLWMQMKAAVLDLPITALKTSDAGTVGSAMMAGIAAGIFADLKDAASHMVEEAETYTPRPEMHAKYMQIYDRYENVYSAVRPLL